MKTNTKVIIGLSVAAAAVLGIVLYSKKKKEKEAFTETEMDDTAIPVGSTTQTIHTPFKSNAEGNAFRAWVNNTYPIFAKAILLDREGSYNNKYIGKAYDKYGAEYGELSALRDVYKKLGKAAKIQKNFVQAKFNNDKNIVTFFPNNTYVITKTFFGLPSGTIQKGSFSHAGQRLVVSSGLNDGKTFEHGSVWTNLAKSIA